MKHSKMIIGIDEAGRGPLAGPVVVAGVKIKGKSKKIKAALDGIRDSKKLYAKKREEWFLRLIRHPDIEWAVAVVPHTVIDRINIYQATLRGARRACAALYRKKNNLVLLDGGLFLPAGIRQKTVIKGDEKIPVISAASIIAKVTRDRIMVRLHNKYPQYRFDSHKGYGTKLHREMIRLYGACPIHRRSFRLL